MPVAEEINVVDEKFSHGRRDRKNNMPRSRVTDGNDPYDTGYRQEEIYQGERSPETSTGGDYRKSGR